MTSPREGGARRTAEVLLREVSADDIASFFEFQLDPEALRMAAFTSEQPGDRGAFDARWHRLLADDSVIKRTILWRGEVAGHVAQFWRSGTPEITYWVGRAFWGQGVASTALAAFLDEVGVRPLLARAAADNVASIRVLEKCGFRFQTRATGFSNARDEWVEEIVLELRGS